MVKKQQHRLPSPSPSGMVKKQQHRLPSPKQHRSPSAGRGQRRHPSVERCIYVAQLHNLETRSGKPLSQLLYDFFIEYGEIEDVFVADNQKWAKIAFASQTRAAEFLKMHRNSSDTIKCLPFVHRKR
jgi:hypothetical protein